MKLYITAVTPEKINKNVLFNYNKTVKNIKTLISEEGIFRIYPNKVERMEINDKPIENINILNLEGILDKSTINSVEEISQVPISHTVSEWTYTYYSLRPKSLVKFVIGEIDNTIGDVYFEIDSNEISTNIEEDIHAFLTKLKFC